MYLAQHYIQKVVRISKTIFIKKDIEPYTTNIRGKSFTT
jgi:hypothetical protein